MPGRMKKIIIAAIAVFGIVFISSALALMSASDEVEVIAAELPSEYMELRDSDIGAGATAVPVAKRGKRVDVSSPGELDRPDTEYVLTGDINSDGTAFTIMADNITLNLNGHKVVYNRKEEGKGPKAVYGIIIPRYGNKDIKIVNGTIEQGAGGGGGNEGGWGHNPVFAEGVTGLEIGGITAVYGGPDIVGFFLHWCYGCEVHHNTIEDRGIVITNRHQGLDAVRIEGSMAKFHHNLVKRTRHRAFMIAADTEIYNNEIYIDSHATNSYGVMAYRVKGFSIHHNKIFGKGEHPIGVGTVSGASDGRIYSNYIEVQNTRKSREYGSAGSACVRITWGADNIEVFGNTLVVKAKNNMIPWFNSWGRAVWAGLPGQGQRAEFRDNVIIANSSDGEAKAAAIAVVCDNESGGLVFRNNKVISNWANVLLSDNYGYAGGSPLFIGNTFVKTGKHSSYRTIRSQQPEMRSTARFIDNSFTDGASPDSMDLELRGDGLKEVGFGWEAAIMVNDALGAPISGAKVVVKDGVGKIAAEGISDGDGVFTVQILEYIITNANGHSGQKVTFAPYSIEASKEGLTAAGSLKPGEREKTLGF